MKQIVLYASSLVLLVFGITTYFASCRPDACVNRAVVCKNGGTCRDGDCICAYGYEGDSCQFRVNEKFASNYACIRTMLINNSLVDDNDDTIRVKAGTDPYSIQFFSIRDSIKEVVSATVNGSYVTIPKQVLKDSLDYWGNGSLSKGVITITLYNRSVSGLYSSKRTYVGYKY
ncbi:MAG: calcium-binding EGF-like domain-containing protein [Chitinophagaceae bacterium]